jgi:uncharacterized protein YneF (UPF0154 family)
MNLMELLVATLSFLIGAAIGVFIVLKCMLK